MLHNNQWPIHAARHQGPADLFLMKGIGALYDPRSGTCTFRVWAPLRASVDVKIIAPVERIVPKDRDAHGYWQATMQGIGPGARYLYRLDSDRDRPDPASRYQPDQASLPTFAVVKWCMLYSN